MNTKNNTINRRSFFRSTALAGGGMIIGFNLFTACKPTVAAPVDLSLLNFNDFNAFIKIADNGVVTIFAPNPEIGQGVKTSMPMIIAEELSVAWENVHVVQGGLDTDVFERQIAGGSESIKHGWNPLRETGATARQMLVNAAAAKWGVDSSECTVKNGVISNSKGESLGYGEVVKEAAVLEVPKDVALKDPKDYTIIGQDVQNVDIDELITGKPLFGLDYKQEGMVYASVLRPPAFGKTLESFDASEAKAMPGVIDVIEIGEKANKLLESDKRNWSVQLAKSNKVVVIAKTTWEAMKAKKAVKATWTDASTLEMKTEMLDELMRYLQSKVKIAYTVVIDKK